MSMSVANKDDDTTSSSCHHHLERLNNASKNAIQIVNRFATIEPPVSSTSSMSIDNLKNDNTDDDNNKNNPWRNPKLIEKELNIVRNELNDAWMELKKNHQNKKGISLENGDDADDQMVLFSETEFRVQYMDMITDAFGDILDEMNKKQESNNNSDDTNFDVEILVDCLQSGMDFLDPSTEYKRHSYYNSLVLPLDNDNDTTMHDDEEENKNDKNEQLTIHQMKQRSLGYLTC